jgi:hypothetical protein
MKGIKALKKDMTCQRFKFEENKTYKEKTAIICEKGFHFCENPLDVLNYYDLCDSEFVEVEALGTIDKQKNGDSKKCTTEIKIGVKIGLSGFVKASVDFLMNLCKKDNNSSKQASSGYSSQQASSGDFSKQASSGDSSKQASSGYSSQQASSGYSSQQASSGDFSKQASSGYSGQQASSGDFSKQASSGDFSKQASSGDSGQQASSGDFSKQASSGDFSKQASSGDSSQQASSGYSSQQASSGDSSQHTINGNYSVAAAIGKNSTIRGKKGNWITLAEWKNDKGKMIPVCVKSAKIDGKKIKENTYYKLINKKFVKA